MDAVPTLPLSDDDRWRRVLARDRGSDGAFVYAVRSTGIFCRPSCGSRRPLRAHVRFFAGPAAAARAGFRPCRRCRPDRASGPDPRRALVERVCKALADATETIPTLAELGVTFKMSPYHLQRVFKATTGISPRAYAATLRLARLKAALKEGEPVAGAIYGAGFGSSSRLYESAPAALGMTPASYAKGGQGAAIFYTVGKSALGRILVAATAKGVAMVSLGDREETLEAALRAEFPHARIARDDARLKPWLGGVLGSLESGASDPALPLDIRATAFERRVWQALRAIPTGETRSYGEIAAAIGKPTAARAVGHACGRNPVALVVPCHRAVGADGRLTGYRWGVERKRALLARERRALSHAGVEDGMEPKRARARKS